MAMTVSDYDDVVAVWTETQELGFSPQFDTKEVINTHYQLARKLFFKARSAGIRP